MNATALRHTLCWRDVPRVSGFIRAFPLLAVSLAALYAVPAHAQAQAPAWPSDQQNQGGQPGSPAWPSDAPRPSPTGVAPGGSGGFGPPQGGGMAPPSGFSQQPGGFGPQGGAPSRQQQEAQACGAEFVRLREEVEKKSKVAKAISDRKGSREELCGAVTGMASAETTWMEFSKKNASRCGIPPDIIKQIVGGHSNLQKMKTNICNAGATAGGPAPAARAPSLSEALGTSRLPDKDNTTVKRGGTLDTMTGNPIR